MISTLKTALNTIMMKSLQILDQRMLPMSGSRHIQVFI